MPTPITVTITAQLSDKLLGDILVTAMEGGSTYWADMRNIVRGPSNGNDDLPYYLSCDFKDSEDKEASWSTVTLASVATGVERILNDANGKYKDYQTLKNACMLLLSDPDAGYDADDADNIIQAACFDEIVYA
jgi:hypothetical protein